MRDTLPIIGYTLLLVLFCLVVGIGIIIFVASLFAIISLPIVIIIWAIGALL